MNMVSEIPRFAIVGHPNKGKSSLVSTLSQDDSVAISMTSGTTQRNQVHPMKVDETILYKLIDTPGFQRARLAMQWLTEHSHSPTDRFDAINLFIKEHKDKSIFDAECQLLTPIMEGAGILYVVDGSVPYGPEYEKEMDILRWTGQPSVALINQIGTGDYIKEWEHALSQYFRIVRTFNTQTADFDKQIQLLDGFSELKENWRQPLAQAVEMLNNQRQERLKESATVIMDMINTMLSASLTREVPDEMSPTFEENTHNEFKELIRTHETTCRKHIEELYCYRNLKREEDDLSIVSNDLFSESTWKLFGLSNDQLFAAGAVSGAATGSTFDLLSSGSTLLLGTGIGAVVGGLTAWFGGEQLIKSSIAKTRAGKKLITLGPIKSLNFPYIILGRAIYHHMEIQKRTHAQRTDIRVQADQNLTRLLFDKDRKKFDKIFAKLKKRTFDPKKVRNELAELIEIKLTEAPDRFNGKGQTD